MYILPIVNCDTPSPTHSSSAVAMVQPYGLSTTPQPSRTSIAEHRGANLCHTYAGTHPSQPNYFALFSGVTQGITEDSCDMQGFSSSPNFASELIAAGMSWASYKEPLTSQGSTTCSSGGPAQWRHRIAPLVRLDQCQQRGPQSRIQLTRLLPASARTAEPAQRALAELQFCLPA